MRFSQSLVSVPQTTRRRGMIAFGEILLLLVGLTILGCLIHFLLRPMAEAPFGNPSSRCRPVYKISLSGDEGSLWVYRWHENLIQIDLASNQIDYCLLNPSVPFSSLASNDDGSRVVTLRATGEIIVFHNGKVEWRHSLPDGERFDTYISDDRAVVVSAASDCIVNAWVQQGSVQQQFQLGVSSKSSVLRIGLNPGASRLFVARDDGSVSILGLDARDQTDLPINFGSENVAFCWSPDENSFAAVTSDSRIRLYDAQSACLRYEYVIDESVPRMHTATLKISPDGRLIVIASPATDDIIVWDADAGRLSGRLKGHSGSVHSLQFSADSSRIFTGGYDGTVREWSLSTYSQIRQID